MAGRPPANASRWVRLLHGGCVSGMRMQSVGDGSVPSALRLGLKPVITDTLLVSALVVSFLLLFGRRVPSYRFTYDEADYAYAASRGWVANYWDERSIPLRTFLERGIRSGREPGDWSSLSAFIRGEGDVTFYRHYHGPLYFYWSLLFKKLGGASESVLRWASFLCLVLSFVALYAGCRSLAGAGPVAAHVSGLLLLFSIPNIQTATQVTPHSLFVLVALVELILLAKVLETGSRRSWYAAIAAASLACLTIEYAPLLIVTLVVVTIMERRRLFGESGPRGAMMPLAAGVVVFAGLVMVLWPGGVFKLSLVKNYAFFAYMALVRGDAYGTSSVLDSWWARFTLAPVANAMTIALAAWALYGLIVRRRDRWALPFAIYAGLMVITTLRNRSLSSTYVSSLFAVLYMLAGLGAARIASRGKASLAAAITSAVAVIVVANAYAYRGRSVARGERSPLETDAVVAHFQALGVKDETLLVPHGLLPTIHFYFPGTCLRSYPIDANPDRVVDQAVNDAFNGLLYRGSEPDRIRRRLEATWKGRVDVVPVPEGLEEQLVYYRLDRDYRGGSSRACVEP